MHPLNIRGVIVYVCIYIPLNNNIAFIYILRCVMSVSKGQSIRKRGEVPSSDREYQMLTPSKQTSRNDRASNSKQYNKNSLTTQCAVHPSEKITNFCTNRECLLPLCPKCVKKHAEEHSRMGVFGDFDTIESSLQLTEDGLKDTFQKLSSLEKVLSDIRQEYEFKLSEERRQIREARNCFVEEVEKLFDLYERTVSVYEAEQNEGFIEDLCSAQNLFTEVLEGSEDSLRKLGNPQTMMEGIINYYSREGQIDSVEVVTQKLGNHIPESLRIGYHREQLERVEALVRRYIDAGVFNQPIWERYRQIAKQANAQLSEEESRGSKQSGKRQKSESIQPREERSKHMPETVKQVRSIESNLFLDKFKSPLDNFSLAKNRQNKQKSRQ